MGCCQQVREDNIKEDSASLLLNRAVTDAVNGDCAGYESGGAGSDGKRKKSSGHYMYLQFNCSCHYMYRTVVTI